MLFSREKRLLTRFGGYACLGATSLQAIRRTVPELGEYGIVLGLGIVGNLAAQLAQLSDARVIGREGFASRIKIAKKCEIRSFVNFKTQNPVEEIKKMRLPTVQTSRFSLSAAKPLPRLNPSNPV
ncbi:MAG: hypothetical protein WCV67_14440 [Victivallaceae bacterium]